MTAIAWLPHVEKKLRIDAKKPQFDEKKLRFGEKKLRFDEKKLRFGEKRLRFDEKKLRIGEKKLRLDGKKLRLDGKKRLPPKNYRNSDLRSGVSRPRLGRLMEKYGLEKRGGRPSTAPYRIRRHSVARADCGGVVPSRPKLYPTMSPASLIR